MRIPATAMMLSMLTLLILCIQDIAALPAEASDNLWKHMTVRRFRPDYKGQVLTQFSLDPSL